MKFDKTIAGFRFQKKSDKSTSLFDDLLEIFKELITHTSGDVDEAINWLKELDKTYQLTTKDYTIDDFIKELKEKGYLREEVQQGGTPQLKITDKTEQAIRKRALEQIFGKLKKSGRGQHSSKFTGNQGEFNGDLRTYEFGDSLDQVSVTESLKNAQSRGFNSQLTENDLVVKDLYYKTQMSTVLMIDISHSMILYGEDRITPAKKVAMALAELITTRYPKDSLDIIVFGNDAWPVKIKDLPYLNVGPYHTNTVAGLELAMGILRRKKHANKQIFMITDGKPSCLKLADGRYYKNSAGLDDYITNKCYQKAAEARKLNIPITSFMIASDPYLQEFIKDFTKANQGKAYYSGLKGLGEMIFEDYEQNKKKKL